MSRKGSRERESRIKRLRSKQRPKGQNAHGTKKRIATLTISPAEVVRSAVSAHELVVVVDVLHVVHRPWMNATCPRQTPTSKPKSPK